MKRVKETTTTSVCVNPVSSLHTFNTQKNLSVNFAQLLVYRVESNLLLFLVGYSLGENMFKVKLNGKCSIVSIVGFEQVFTCFNPFDTAGLFLYQLKISGFVMFSGGIERD